MITVKQINSYDDWVLIGDRWNAVLDQNDTQLPFLTFEWLTTWWNAFGNTGKHSLYILLVFEGENIIGIAPLMKWKTNRRLFPIRKISFLANEYSNRIDFIVSGKKEESYLHMWNYLEQHRDEWDEIELTYLPTQSETIQQLDSCDKIQMRCIKRDFFNSLYLDIDRDWDSFFSNKSRNLRTTLKRKWNRLAKLGLLTVKELSRKEDVDDALNKLFIVADKSWQAKQGTAISSTPELRLFYSQFAHRASEKNWLSLWMLLLDETPIAVSYSIRYQGTEYSLKTHYDPKYYLLSPGRLLLWQNLQAAFNSKIISKYDFLGVPEPYKEEWTNQLTSHSMVFLYHKGIYSSTLYHWRSLLFQMNDIRKTIGIELPWLKRMYRSFKKIWQPVKKNKKFTNDRDISDRNSISNEHC